MTRLEDRQILVRDIEQGCADGSHLTPACARAGIDVRTLPRWKAGDGLPRGIGGRMPLVRSHRPR
jgi:putative transposase